MALVQKEIEIHAAVSAHPSILPLLAHDIIASRSAPNPQPVSRRPDSPSGHVVIDMDSEATSTAYLLFPAYHGTLAEEVERLALDGKTMGLTTCQILGIFIQVAFDHK